MGVAENPSRFRARFDDRSMTLLNESKIRHFNTKYAPEIRNKYVSVRYQCGKNSNRADRRPPKSAFSPPKIEIGSSTPEKTTVAFHARHIVFTQHQFRCLRTTTLCHLSLADNAIAGHHIICFWCQRPLNARGPRPIIPRAFFWTHEKKYEWKKRTLFRFSVRSSLPFFRRVFSGNSCASTTRFLRILFCMVV